MYQSSQLQVDVIPDYVQATFVPTRGVVMYPQIIYPPNGVILCDIGNTTGEPITNARLLFRGSKLFDSTAVSAPTYPSRLAALPFTYQTIVKSVTPNTSPVLDNQLYVKNDADFAFRLGVCDPFGLAIDGAATSLNSVAPQQFREVYVQMKDESRKYYSNQPIHVNDLFGQCIPVQSGANTGPDGNLNNDEVLWMPGMFTPEIYIPRDHSLYFDVYRFDDPTDPVTGGNVDLWFRFVGAKVFRQ
jgi:hypothetical protein